MSFFSFVLILELLILENCVGKEVSLLHFENQLMYI